MTKQMKIVVVILIILFIWFGLRFIIGGSEDTWICVDNEWVKHGVPSAPMPTEPCGEKNSTLSEAEALIIAEETCIKGGESLSTPSFYNENSKTWWFDANLNSTPEGCNPACVVSEETKTAEINWRCTGAILETKCKEEQRNVDACIEIYQPVCATVNIQCITTPCDPIEETYENSCKACDNSLVSSYKEGECK